jgi:hypothetical protein
MKQKERLVEPRVKVRLTSSRYRKLGYYLGDKGIVIPYAGTIVVKMFDAKNLYIDRASDIARAS